MKIGIDLDEVLADFMPPLLAHFHKKKGTLHTRDEFKEYKWWVVWGVTREEAIAITDEFHEAHALEDIQPLQGAISGVKQLLREKNTIYLITARPARFKQKVESWLKHHFNTEKIKVIHAGDFHKSQGATKAEICKELKIEIMLEDSGETAIECVEAGIPVLLFDKPWNQMYKHQHITRVSTWKEAMQQLQLNSMSG